MGNSWMILAIGFLAQGFFSARILVQWLLSERARKVLSPSIFWILSIVGSYLLCLYGWLRDDFSIVMGQFLSYYIYLWNLKLKGVWGKVPLIGKAVLVLTPIVAIGFAADNAVAVYERFLCNEKVPLPLLLWGSMGQILFTMRFVYQWAYSCRHGESRLPAGFWLISLVGSLSIVSYGVMRSDLVLMVGQSFGVVAYVRNLMLIKNEKNRK